MASESFVIDSEDLEWITDCPEGALIDFDDFKVTIVENEQIDEHRWVSVHRVVWCENHEGENRYFACYYEQPLTELQEGSESELDCADIWEVKRKVEIKEVVSYA